MLRFNRGVAGGLAVGVAAAVATIFTITTDARSVAPSAKADRLPANASAASRVKRIATVEVIGVRDAAVVYRDREGRVLFSTDPVANVTIVTKNLALPEVTIRETADSQVEPVPIDKTQAPGGDKPRPTQGCDTGLSPDISPTVPTSKGRCLVEIRPASGFASLR